MASSFPKMQKGSANFSQSIRNRLRLKNLQAQAKNFCRVLDIRVPQIMEADAAQAVPLQHLLKVAGQVLWADARAHLTDADVALVAADVGIPAEPPVLRLLCPQPE